MISYVWRRQAMSDHLTNSRLSRRELFGTVGKALVLTPIIGSAAMANANAPGPALTGIAGIDRVTVLGGKTYLRGWAGYGDRPEPGRGGRGGQARIELIGMAITSPRTQRHLPMMFCCTPAMMSRSIGVASPVQMRSNIFTVQLVPSRQGVHLPQDSWR